MADQNEQPGILDSIVDWVMGGKKTKPLRSATPVSPMTPRQQDNTMVKAAAEEAARRARTRGDIAPEAVEVLKGPVGGAKGK